MKATSALNERRLFFFFFKNQMSVDLEMNNGLKTYFIILNLINSIILDLHPEPKDFNYVWFGLEKKGPISLA